MSNTVHSPHRHLMLHQIAAALLARALTHPHSHTPRRNPLMVAIRQSRSLRMRTAISCHTLAPSNGSNSPSRVCDVRTQKCLE